MDPNLSTADPQAGAAGTKPKRKKASRACSHCQKAHLTCDDARPCARCVKKGLATTCADGQRKKAKYLLEEDELRERRASEDRVQASSSRTHEALPADLSITHQIEDTSMEDSTNVLLASSAALPSYAAAASFDSPASAATGPSGAGDGTYASMLDSDAAFNTSFHPFGTENASLEYSMLSSMIYGSGIDPTLLGTGLDDLGLSQASFYNDAAGPSSGTGLQMTQSIGPGMYDGTSGGAGVESVMYDGTSGGAGVGVSGSPWATTLQVPDSTNSMGPVTQTTNLFDPVLAPPMASISSPSLAVNSYASLMAEPSLGPSSAPMPSSGSAPINLNSPSNLSTPPQPLALQRFARANPHPSPDPNATLNQLLRLRPEEEDWDTRIRRVHTDRIEPFHYTDGYHFLINYVTANYEREEALRVVRALAIIRPSLIALQMPLSEEDEIFVERSIQRMALEFEKLIAFSGTPTVVWRRTCEICVVGSEFSMLTHWPREELIGKHIYQFLDKKSTIEYWEKFAMHAFENTSQSVVARCTLLTPQGKPVPCSACFSIKRDMFDLPSLIVGNFLPIL
ncbi:hypothetical protein A4X09_0g1339 [Tilletia walkeri]|uniref:Transcription activator of gluconeogenesis ERT1 n=1 Tax=Tilletia walkeri TaxID=117179 RepID=A0A8X7T7K2_9BASI|nr:hypothetical protein A4X09_0g1339 [Tilletia walkeri]